MIADKRYQYDKAGNPIANILSNPIDMQAGSTYSSSGEEEKDLYFFHTDHLGSSTYITDINGEIAQYSAYTPYGEMFREYRDVTPYRFNGKELDTETGLYYYGARYYNPATALWLGVDPLASKYPGVSPYVYCVSNPVKYVDPDGREGKSIIQGIKELLSIEPYSPQIDDNGNVVVDNNMDAVLHYYRGEGRPVAFGNDTKKIILGSKDVNTYIFNIKNGITSQPASGGPLDVNVTNHSTTFHIGNTTFVYRTKCDENTCTATYTIGTKDVTIRPSTPCIYKK